MPEIRKLSSIRTMNGLVDRRRSRSTASAMLELAVLAAVKQFLQNELNCWRRRQADILKRLAEIAEKEAHLKAFVEGQDAAIPPPVPAPGAQAPGVRPSSGPSPAVTASGAPRPPGARVAGRVKAKEFSY